MLISSFASHWTNPASYEHARVRNCTADTSFVHCLCCVGFQNEVGSLTGPNTGDFSAMVMKHGNSSSRTWGFESDLDWKSLPLLLATTSTPPKDHRRHYVAAIRGRQAWPLHTCAEPCIRVLGRGHGMMIHGGI